MSAVRIAALLAVSAAGLLAPAPASGATATHWIEDFAECNGCPVYTEELLRYEAGGGEANRVRAVLNREELLVSDVVPITPERNCRRVTDTEVRCGPLLVPGNTDRVFGRHFLLGDLDDVLGLDPTGSAWPLSVDGGPGADRLTHEGAGGEATFDGGAGNDTLTGGPEHDSLTGGADVDTLTGGGGDDRVRDPEGAGDTLDGGVGSDFADYFPLREAVVVDLADPAPDGPSGATDTLVAIEAAGGAFGDDVLRGSPDANMLLGAHGADQLEGGAGDDLLAGDRGADRMDAGAGDDTIESGEERFIGPRPRRPPPEVLECGAGSDLVRDPDVRDVLRADCETVAPFRLGSMPAQPLRISARAVDLRLTCPRALLVRRRCRGTANLALAGGRSIGRVRFALPAGRGRLRIPLADRRALADPGGRRLEVSFRVTVLSFEPQRRPRRQRGTFTELEGYTVELR